MSKIGYVGLALIGWSLPNSDETLAIIGIICVFISFEIAKLSERIDNCGPWY